MLIKDNNLVILNYFSTHKSSSFFIRGVSRCSSSNKGTKVIRSRKGSKLRKFVLATFNLRPSGIFLVSSIFFSKRIYSFFMFLESPTGIKFNTILFESSKLFSYFISNSKMPYNKLLNFISTTSQLIYLKSNARISLLQLNTLSRLAYVRASGSSATLISSSLKRKSSLVRLPSGEVKIFSILSSCNIGGVSFKKKSITVKGDWCLKRLKGFKPVVRGIAMNPVDHPHGGKKKSVRFPRNPWGFAAKKK